MRVVDEFQEEFHDYWFYNTRAQNIRDYRSISLLGTMYKIIPKILARILKKVLGGLTPPYQKAFVEGGCGFIVSEVIDSKIKEGKGGMVFTFHYGLEESIG